MQVEELFDLTTWIKQQVADKNIVQNYRQLHTILQQNSQPNQQKLPFENEKNVLIESLIGIPFANLSLGQIEVLGEIGIAQNAGTAGVEALEETLFKNAIDVATAAQKIQKSISDLERGIQWAQQTRTQLAEITRADDFYEEDGTVLLRVRFTGKAHLDNLTEFMEWGKTWWEIGRGISMAADDSPEGIKVVGASKGSIILTLAACYPVAKLASAILMEAFKLAESLIHILQEVEKLKALKISNKAASLSLEEAAKSAQTAAEQTKEKGIESIVEMAVREANTEGDGEKTKVLTLAVKKLVDFIEKGGEIDFVMPDEPAQDADDENDAQLVAARNERSELRNQFVALRELEQHVKQLEKKE